MMKINVLLFGIIRDIVGSNAIVMDDVNDTNELVQKLQSMFPQLTNSKYTIAVNRHVVQNNTMLGQNAEVAVLPPFSGG